MGETIEIQAADGPAEAYLAGDSGRPGVLFYVDAIGLRPQIEEMADRIASWGYVVLAPHVFYRDGAAADLAPQGDLRDAGAREAFFAGGVMDRVGGLTPDRSGPDAEAWVGELAKHAGDGPIGVTGYCMGARLAVRTAGQFPGTVAAVGGFHGGRLVTDAADSPHLAIAAVHRGVRLRPRRPGRLDAGRAGGGARGGARRRRAGRTSTRSTPAPRTATRWPTPRCTTRPPPSATSPCCATCSTAPSRGPSLTG